MKAKIKKTFPFSFKDLFIMIIILGIASGICAILRFVSTTDSHVPLIFVLAVAIVSICTEGYLYGIISSILAVLGVNLIFTYPYLAFNFTLTGYPLTFICMFAVSIIICTLMSRIRENEELKMEAEKEKVRANLLRSISHDFRTPLTTIMGSIDVMKNSSDKLSEEEKTKLLDDAQQECEWLINVVENLLSITRMGGDASSYINKTFQAVEEVIGDSLAHVKTLYPEYNIEIELFTEPVFVDIDETLIKQVLNNLLINAATHAKGSTKAIVSVLKDKKFAKIIVEDDGIGFCKKKEETRNVGIGLQVCDAIIQAHGGKLIKENRKEGGARVSFTLPLAKIEFTEDQEGLHGY